MLRSFIIVYAGSIKGQHMHKTAWKNCLLAAVLLYQVSAERTGTDAAGKKYIALSIVFC